jgi:cytochrome c oxidase subunit I+III
VSPSETSYGASIFTFGFLNGTLAFALIFMAAFIVVRIYTGQFDQVRRLSFDTTKLLWAYALGQAVITVIVTHLFPRLVS